MSTHYVNLCKYFDQATSVIDTIIAVWSLPLKVVSTSCSILYRFHHRGIQATIDDFERRQRNSERRRRRRQRNELHLH